MEPTNLEIENMRLKTDNEALKAQVKKLEHAAKIASIQKAVDKELIDRMTRKQEVDADTITGLRDALGKGARLEERITRPPEENQN